MQALTPEQYRWLDRLAHAYLRQHAQTYEFAEGCNPRLGVDALCFQRLGEDMLGVLVTPLSLSLALVPDGSHALGSRTEHSANRRIVSLPSGQYPFIREFLGDEAGCLWRCELLNGLAVLNGPDDASRLAQRLMQQIMSPAEDESNTRSE